MNYIEAETTVVTLEQALAELRRHRCDATEIEEFLMMYGDRDELDGAEVLEWLGY